MQVQVRGLGTEAIATALTTHPERRLLPTPVQRWHQHLRIAGAGWILAITIQSRDSTVGVQAQVLESFCDHQPPSL